MSNGYNEIEFICTANCVNTVNKLPIITLIKCKNKCDNKRPTTHTHTYIPTYKRTTNSNKKANNYAITVIVLQLMPKAIAKSNCKTRIFAKS